jgi:hypothetical protein
MGCSLLPLKNRWSGGADNTGFLWNALLPLNNKWSGGAENKYIFYGRLSLTPEK